MPSEDLVFVEAVKNQEFQKELSLPQESRVSAYLQPMGTQVRIGPEHSHPMADR